MTKKLYVYDTDRKLTRKIMERFTVGASMHEDWIVKFLVLDEYRSFGIPADADAVASLGILRGTGLMFKEAQNRGLDWYYFDHAYFNPGYGDYGWLRVVHNGHTMNYRKPADNERWKQFFKANNLVGQWKTKNERGGDILILPGTNAVQWFFDDHDWENRIIEKLKRYLPEEDHHRIKIRCKPNEPIVDKMGNLIDLKKTENAEPIDDALRKSFCVIAYNSMAALYASLKGYPVITSENNCCYSISQDIDNFQHSAWPQEFDIEPMRAKLCFWLSHCQYNRFEIGNGECWKDILIRQGNNNVKG
jgi:hypothetical protein